MCPHYTPSPQYMFPIPLILRRLPRPGSKWQKKSSKMGILPLGNLGHSKNIALKTAFCTYEFFEKICLKKLRESQIVF